MTLARVFAPIPRILTRTFAVPSPAIWIRHRDDGTEVSDELKVLFNAASEKTDLDGLVISTGKPMARCAQADALALEPSRAAGKPEVIFRNDGRDELVIGGKAYEIESCRTDGYGMLELELIG